MYIELEVLVIRFLDIKKKNPMKLGDIVNS
mgnify:CR=1 FL=1